MTDASIFKLLLSTQYTIGYKQSAKMEPPSFLLLDFSILILPCALYLGGIYIWHRIKLNLYKFHIQTFFRSSTRKLYFEDYLMSILFLSRNDGNKKTHQHPLLQNPKYLLQNDFIGGPEHTIP